jgi:hypothetical protein
MADLKLRHEMNCDADTYWEKCVLDAEYNRRLFYDELKFKSYTLVEQNDQGDVVLRKVKAEPRTANLPGPIVKAIGDSFGYTEEGTYDRKAKRYTFKTIPGGFPDKVKINGSMYCEPAGDKKVVRITEIHVEVKIFMIGGMVEDRVVADIKHSYAKAAEFTNVWVKEKGY